MALGFNPFEKDQPTVAPAVGVGARKYAKLNVFDDPPPAREPVDFEPPRPEARLKNSETTRRQLEDNSKTKGSGLGDNSETTRRQKVSNSETTRRQLEDDSKTKRERPGDDSETTRRRIDVPELPTRRRLGDDSETKALSVSANSETTRRHKASNSKTTRRQLEDDSETESSRLEDNSKTTRRQIGLEDELTRRQVGDDSETERDADSKTKRPFDSKTKRDLPSSSMQLKLLRYLAEEQGDEGQTTPLSRQVIAEATGFEKKSVPQTMRRLVAAGFVRQVSYSNSCSDGGGSFAVPRHVLARLATRTANSETKRRLNSETKLGDNSETRSDVVSSSLRNPTTTTRSGNSITPDPGKLQDLVGRLRLDDDDLRIGANDLAEALRLTSLDFALFVESVEHVAFYARGADGATLKHRKAWCMKQLKAGYYAAPAGFISWEEQQEIRALEARQQKLARLRELQAEKFNTDFEIWRLELPQPELEKLLGGSFMNATSRGAQAVLREEFAKRTGQMGLLETSV